MFTPCTRSGAKSGEGRIEYPLPSNSSVVGIRTSLLYDAFTIRLGVMRYRIDSFQPI